MYNQPEAILEQYDLEINQITKGRGAYICDTGCGMKLLVPFRGSKERAAFLLEALKRLEEAGCDVEQIVPTKEGEPLAEDETGGRYWLKTCVTGSECSTSREGDMVKAVRLLAGLHTAIEACAFEVPDFMVSDRNEPGQMYERHYRELVKLKNYVRGRRSKNAFERSFQEQYPRYIEEAGRALELMGQQGVPYRLCHGDMNQHNVVRTPAGLRIINFENMCWNPAVSDLANFLRKLLEKNNWNSGLGMRLLTEYQRQRPLAKEELRHLYLTLLFPEKFWKIANHYANSHKVLSGRDMEKLDKVIAQEGARSIFLEKLFSIV
ncbi:MAG: phosphotransferase [Muribaculaceae bacterium]|nr:phosphotransferase [Roseburia sp.]MCM1431401.1 phosphotransferase [Muribaculaceae bacterium]MCM1491843.1 phosphotransferase [Muribaculaceae bacterium]